MYVYIIYIFVCFIHTHHTHIKQKIKIQTSYGAFNSPVCEYVEYRALNSPICKVTTAPVSIFIIKNYYMQNLYKSSYHVLLEYDQFFIIFHLFTIVHFREVYKQLLALSFFYNNLKCMEAN